ncbi:MAG: group-specific protein [Cohnella sp.]|jgi:hypothetical protein|nr:group-specific protein [Cohnella sp.]
MGAAKVARGFAVGFGLEIILPYTVYLGYLLLYPLIILFRTTLPPVLIGNVICKVTLLPLILIPLGNKLSLYIPISKPNFMPKLIFKYLKTLLGLSICAVVIGLLAYVVMFVLYEMNRKYRLKTRKTGSFS